MFVYFAAIITDNQDCCWNCITYIHIFYNVCRQTEWKIKSVTSDGFVTIKIARLELNFWICKKVKVATFLSFSQNYLNNIVYLSVYPNVFVYICYIDSVSDISSPWLNRLIETIKQSIQSPITSFIYTTRQYSTMYVQENNTQELLTIECPRYSAALSDMYNNLPFCVNIIRKPDKAWKEYK